MRSGLVKFLLTSLQIICIVECVTIQLKVTRSKKHLNFFIGHKITIK